MPAKTVCLPRKTQAAILHKKSWGKGGDRVETKTGARNEIHAPADDIL
jgi:hypothetical protein